MSIDIVARGAAAAAANRPHSTRSSPTACRIFGGRIANERAVSTNVRTYETVIALAAPADAIRLIYAFGQTAAGDATPIRAMSFAASVASVSDADIQAADPDKVYVQTGGESQPLIAPAKTAERRNLVRSDWMPIRSVPRSDGGEGAIYAVRTTLWLDSGTGKIMMLGSDTDSFENWESRADGRIFRSRSKGGVTSGNWSGFLRSNSVSDSASPVVGIEYMARGEVVSVVGFGDSITEGRGTFLGEGFGHPACVAASTNETGIPFEWSNFGWSGQSLASVRMQVEDYLSADLSISLAILPHFSPNGVGSAIQASDIASQAFEKALSANALSNARIPVFGWTGLPVAPVIYDYNATDRLRQEYNSNCLDTARHGSIVLDFAGALSGSTDGDGQVSPADGTMIDGIHPSDAGNAKLASILTQALKEETFLRFGRRFG